MGIDLATCHVRERTYIEIETVEVVDVVLVRGAERRRRRRRSVRHGYYGYVCGLSSVLGCIGKGPRRVVPVAFGVAVSLRFSAVLSGCDSDSGRSWGSVVELDEDGSITLIS